MDYVSAELGEAVKSTYWLAKLLYGGIGGESPVSLGDNHDAETEPASQPVN